MAASYASTGRVPRRREVTRERILNAAESIFLENGFRGAYIEEIAAKAGYTTGSIYSNFKDKDGLFLAVVEARWRRLNAERPDGEPVASPEDGAALMASLMADEDLRKWESVTMEYFGYALRDPKASAAYKAMMERVAANFAEMIAPLAEASDIPNDKFARIVSALMNGLGRAAMSDDSFDDAELFALVLKKLTE
jgi:AcrR family transcriptional regulator